MSIKTINEQGAINLVRAIVNQAAKDFMHTTPDSDARKLIEWFFLSDYFEMLTGSSGIALLSHLRRRYNEKQKTRKGKHHENHQD